MYEIISLIENGTFVHNLLASHGQSLLIKTPERTILFDVGEIYEGLVYNLKLFSIPLEDIDDIVISHRHIDHIGALDELLPELKNQKLYLPTQMGESDYKEGPAYRFLPKKEQYNVGVEPEIARRLEAYPNAIIAKEPVELAPNIYTSGCIGDWMHEQAIIIDQKDLGITVLVACSHPEVEELVKQAIKVTGNQKVRSIIGGFHYNKMDEEEVIEKTKVLKEFDPEFIIPNHCTGKKQTDILKRELGDIVKVSKTNSFGVGNSLTLGEKVEFNLV